MTDRSIVVAPHPDDETLGCGGTLLRLAQRGATLAWLIVSGISPDNGWPAERVRQRELEIDRVARFYGFAKVYNLALPTARLDTISMSDLIDKFAAVFREFQPEQVFLPNPTDAHTDHRLVFNAGSACTKWFRYPTIRRVLSYETLSETECALDERTGFHPNYFVDISEYLERKIEAMQFYQSELAPFPFPRSDEAVRALAALRGATSGFRAAEAFCLLRERC